MYNSFHLIGLISLENVPGYFIQLVYPSILPRQSVFKFSVGLDFALRFRLVFPEVIRAFFQYLLH